MLKPDCSKNQPANSSQSQDSTSEVLAALSPQEKELLKAITGKGYPLQTAIIALQKPGHQTSDQVFWVVFGINTEENSDATHSVTISIILKDNKLDINKNNQLIDVIHYDTIHLYFKNIQLFNWIKKFMGFFLFMSLWIEWKMFFLIQWILNLVKKPKLIFFSHSFPFSSWPLYLHEWISLCMFAGL